VEEGFSLFHLEIFIYGKYRGVFMETEIIVLGVGHSIQLASKECQAAVYRAFLDRIKPDVICLERAPLEYNRSDFYEFTYEQELIIIPYAKKNKISLYPFDWLPSTDDQQLAWNLDNIEEPPFVRGKDSYKDFLYFSETTIKEEGFFYSETNEFKLKMEKWLKSAQPGESDFPRRLFLYRTYMQAMRIKHIAKVHRGEKILIVVGHMHKKDIEDILNGVPTLNLINPMSFGLPTSQEVSRNIETEDLFAIASFNLLGIQSQHFIDSEWLMNLFECLEDIELNIEVKLLKTRMDVLKNSLNADDAIKRYLELVKGTDSQVRFTFNGGKDISRIDSYFDPFGNLLILDRLYLEIAREYSKLDNIEKVLEFKKLLLNSGNLSSMQKLQLNAYWDNYITKMN
jgi:hypothetical protein